MQTTLKSSVSFSGAGLHSGQPARMTVLPASAEHGIWFKRTDVSNIDRLVPARWDVAKQTALCTRLENDSGVSVSTVEHIMAAIAGCGVQNALIEIDGPEVPIADGSAKAFVNGIIGKGLQKLEAPVRAIEVLKSVEVSNGLASARIEPADSLQIDFQIDFEDAAIGQQEKKLNMANGAFVRELCTSRTFCREADIADMHARGLALGGNLDNAVVVSGDTVLTPGGLRHHDEAVRHKMLDALGDLALAGAPLLGRYVGNRAGHSLTNQLLRTLFATPGATRMVVCDEKTAARLPGRGVRQSDLKQLA